MKNNKKTAVIYANYTHTGVGIKKQVEEAIALAESNNYAIYGIYVDTGTTSDNRASFKRMILDSEKKVFQYVLVSQNDRFARSQYDNAMFRQKLKANDVRVLSARENTSADASGIILEALLEGVAEFYSAELGRKKGCANAENYKKRYKEKA